MRNSFFAFATVLALSVVGCGDDSTTVTTGTDMARDIASPVLDLTSLNTSTCGDLLGCTNACTTAACSTACVKKGTTSAQADYKALISCIDTACPQNPAVDGGTNAACSYDATSGNFIDKAACDACVSGAQQTGGACVTILATCNSDGA